MQFLQTLPFLLLAPSLALTLACGPSPSTREKTTGKADEAVPKAPAPPPVASDDPQALYARAKKCMDELAIDDCAIESLEALRALPSSGPAHSGPAQKQSPTIDVHLRLLELYRRNDKKQARDALLTSIWERPLPSKQASDDLALFPPI